MGDPIRILQVVVNMNRGGAETLLMNLYRNIDHSKVQFDFLTSKEGVFDEEILKMGGKIHRIPYVSDVGHYAYIKALNKFFSSHSEYKIVHSHLDKMSGFVLRSAERTNTPIRIAHSHNTSSEGGVVAKAYKWIAGKYILPCATHYFACSDKAANWLFEDKVVNATILKNGIESDQYVFNSEVRNQVRQELNLSRDTFVIGHVGRFAHQKNHSFLIDIFAQLNNDKPDSVLVLAGDGPLRLDIEKKVRDLNLLGKVIFLGIRNDINRLLQAFDVFVFPSWHEGLPVTLIEAQGSGLPCIISDVITSEVDMGAGLVQFENLNKPSDAWAKRVIQQNKRVLEVQDHIQKKGFDIRVPAKWLQKFYLDQTEEWMTS
ncbi:glycosyltransferase family 1 protein [Paenibacillus sp. MAH-36]|uniref:Glycosyltransferase family 1 protein n=1 Tax=Paenibacillus violae TaxID=3077234 RepID=A0ABU3RI83_9BACL|nr:glycosyltransferase family 1 protein [Paenibacillus sp. PFR10]MDU0203791.1 glycosyltransferase family 1 protein [Paenibacillus sp. PFR10]